MAVIVGTSGNDMLWGTGAADEMRGGDGNDQLMGSSGNDSIAGEGGDDNIHGEGGSDTLDGGAGNDALTDDSVENDRLFGGPGDDHLDVQISFSSGQIFLDGGDGDDSLRMIGGQPLIVTALGGAGADRATVWGQVTGSVDLGAGDDLVLVYAQAGALTLTLGAGADTIQFARVDQTRPHGPVTVTDFNPAQDQLTGDIAGYSVAFQNWNGQNPFATGHFQLLQSGSAVLLRADWDGGGDGYVDIFRFENLQVGQLAALTLFGFPGSGAQPAGSTLTGAAAVDRFEGGLGEDRILGGGGDDVLNGMAGDDTLEGGAGADVLYGWIGRDVLHGDDGDDILGGAVGDRLFGDAGNDSLGGSFYDGPPGGATLDGGLGDDHLDLYFTRPGYSAVAAGGDGADSFSVYGAGHATLDGGAGADRFTLFEATGEVVITMGGSVDTLGFANPGSNPQSSVISRAVVQDFQAGPGGDRVELLNYLRTVAAGWDQDTNPFATGHLQLIGSGADSILQLKVDGAWRDLVVFRNVQPSQLTPENLDGWPSSGAVAPGVVLVGTAGAETLAGHVGPDVLSGSAGDDSLTGGLGADQMHGGEGRDTLDGGPGSDDLQGGDGADAFVLSAGRDTIHGGAGDDRTTGYGGVLGGQFFGEAGNDDFWISSGQWRQTATPILIDLGDGDDVGRFWASYGSSGTVLGGAGADRIELSGSTFDGPIRIVADAGSGNDTVTLGGGGVFEVTLGTGADIVSLGGVSLDGGVTAGMQAVVLDFNLAEDRISGTNGNMRLGQMNGEAVIQVRNWAEPDAWQTALRLQGVGATALTSQNFMFGGVLSEVWLLGGAGGEALTVSGGFNRLDGGGGDDQVIGAGAADTLLGGAGADTITAFDGNDVLDGGGGDDRAFGGLGHDSLTGGGGQNFLRGEEGDDTIVGGGLFDDLHGNMGNDTVRGGGGDDWVVGGKDGDALFGDDGGDVVLGNLGVDTVDGGFGDDVVRGGQGDDIVRGGLGNDWVSGDRGSDTLSGGWGADNFHVFDGSGVDRITDFNAAQGDRVWLLPGTQWSAAQVGADTVVTVTGAEGGQLVLVGVTLASLPTGWIFGA